MSNDTLMAMPDPPASLRDRKAQLTRDEILGAARQLFAERGYARTSVRDIAKAAGVSAQTVYDSVGPKPALVTRLNDLIDREADIGGIVSAAAQSQDPLQLAATPARVTRSILEHCGDIVHALVTGAAAEPDLAAALAEGQRRHREGIGRMVGMMAKLGHLGPGVDPDVAAETLAALSDVRFALVLRESYGWSLDEMEARIAALNRTVVLGADSPSER
jgi:AcrR family transcriptional regulator